MTWTKGLDDEVYKGPHCWECGSRRTERLSSELLLNGAENMVEMTYCSNKCKEKLIETAKMLRQTHSN